jgi:ribosomal protein S11
VLRGLQAGGLKVADIRDVTPVPTNGCRPKAARRL